MKVFFLIHDDYAAGGLQRSTMTARECLVAGGHEASIYCIRLVPEGLAARHSFVRLVTGLESFKLLFWWKFLIDLRALVARERPAVCIGMGLTSSVLLALATFGLPDVRVLGSERAWPGYVTGFKLRFLRRLAFPQMDGLICQTNRTAQYYISSMGISPAKLHVIPNIVGPAALDPPQSPPELASFADHPLVACIGRMEHQKGFDMALSIFSGILSQRSDVRFVLIGEGPSEAQYRAEAHSLGLGDKVLFLPRLESLAGVWQEIDVFLLTSRYEGIPNVLAEAMANGTACVAFDCPTGPSELITDKQDGFLIEPNNCDEATKRCIELLDDKTARQQVGEQAARVVDRFSRKEICERWNLLVARQDPSLSDK